MVYSDARTNGEKGEREDSKLQNFRPPQLISSKSKKKVLGSLLLKVEFFVVIQPCYKNFPLFLRLYFNPFDVKTKV